MGSIIVVVILALAVWNALRTMSRQKKRMKDWACSGDCKTCKTPCGAKRIYHIEETNQPQ